MIQRSSRPFTSSSSSTNTADVPSLTSSTARRGKRSTRTPNKGAARPGMTKQRITEPARALLPVRSLVQMPSPSRNTVSPNIETICPISRMRKSRCRRSSRIGCLSVSARQREGVQQPLHEPCALGPFGSLECSPLERSEELEELPAQLQRLLRRRPEREVAALRGVGPLLGQPVVTGLGLPHLGEAPLVDDVAEQRRGGTLRLRLAAAEGRTDGDVPPRSLAALSVAGLLDEPPLGQLAEVIRAAGGAVVQTGGALARRHGALDEEQLDEVKAARVR